MSRLKILFVDDEERIVRLLRMIFRSDYDVYTALRGAEAIELLKQQEIDVLVSDQRMPEMTGIELLSEARRISPDTVRLLLTGYSDLVSIIGAVNEGEVFRFLNKPWDQDEIKASIAEAANVATVARELARRRAQHHSQQQPPLTRAVMMLSLDGLDNDRHEVMELFADDHTIMPVRSFGEAEDILREIPGIGVIIAECEETDSNRVDMLAQLGQKHPSITIIMLAGSIDSDLVIKLINEAKIYRFAIKPIQPNVFRLAVSAAMKEHHRRLALGQAEQSPVSEEAGPEDTSMVTSIVRSLSRFTKVR